MSHKIISPLSDQAENCMVWLTRPSGQSGDLQEILQEKGVNILAIPMLEIEALDYNQAIKSVILDLDQYELVFFISTNAARIGMECIRSYWPQYPVGVDYFAVGPSTARLLEDYGLQVHYPSTGMNTEALLALPELQDIEDKRALIMRGQGGRELLAQGLRDKGARVDYAEVYRRRQPQYPRDYLQDCLKHRTPQGIVISSAEALDNFKAIFRPWWQQLKDVPLFVSSERLRNLASEAGFARIILMPGADDAAIAGSLETYFG